jgi:lipoprotein-anchoring transpeptidase ErfK/SrfK
MPPHRSKCTPRRSFSRPPFRPAALVSIGALLLGACDTSTRDRADAPIDSAEGRVAVDSATPPVPDTADFRVEIDLSQRRLHVIGGAGDTIARHRVAVGSNEWPTRPGNWAIQQVVLNPEWTPPDESWAEEREGKAPGAPDNPLGVAQLVYDLPRTIHGTNDPSSIGKAVSHGSIRVTNADALALSRLVLERTGAGDVDDRLSRANSQRTEKQVIDLPKVVPIRVF